MHPDKFHVAAVNNVINIDLRKGCLGCSFCITMRDRSKASQVLKENPLKKPADPDTLLKILDNSLVYTKTNLPLRVCSTVDGSLIPVRSHLIPFYEGISRDHPFMFLIRGKYSNDLKRFLNSQKINENFILVQSLTPKDEALKYDLFDPQRRLSEFLSVAIKNKVLNIAPLTEPMFNQVKSLLKELPKGLSLIFAPLNKRGLRDEQLEILDRAIPMTDEHISELEAEGLDRQMQIYRSNTCATSSITGRPSPDYYDMQRHDETLFSQTSGTSHGKRASTQLCTGCSGYDLCKSLQRKNLEIIPTLRKGLEIAKLDHVFKSAQVREGLIELDLSQEITKTDTTWLSGFTSTRVTQKNSRLDLMPEDLERLQKIIDFRGLWSLQKGSPNLPISSQKISA